MFFFFKLLFFMFITIEKRVIAAFLKLIINLKLIKKAIAFVMGI